MNKSIYDEALGLLLKIQGRLSTDYDKFLEVKHALEQAKKQELEHTEYSKKVQEQFSNDTKRIGELESKLIKQEKLLKLYKDLISTKDDMLSCCEVYEDEYYDIEEIATDLKLQIKELENE